MNPRVLIAFTLTIAAGTAFAASGFLSDYSKLKSVSTAMGTDRIYAAPDAGRRLAAYSTVLIPQPEVHFSPDSEYKGLNPDDVKTLSTLMRDALKTRIEAGGLYKVVDQPAANAVVARTALTNVYLKKKKRGLLAYTPVGAVAKVGVDALRETLDKVDIIEMSFEGELTDSKTGDLLVAIVVERGARKAEGQKEQRIDMDEFNETIAAYGTRFRCRLDNARLPEAQWKNCLDPQPKAP